MGIQVHYIPYLSEENITPLLNDKTRAVFGEVISNPGLDVIDVSAVAAFVHTHQVPLILDSTTATPLLIRPLKLGADVVVHSSSKYINGSGNSISGIIVDGGKFKWDKDRISGNEGIQQIRKVCLHCKTSKRCVEKYGWVSRANERLP